MDINYYKILETGTVLVLYFIIRLVLSKIVDKTLKDRFFHKSRGKAIKKITRIVLTVICIAFIFLIWGVDQSDLALFIGSILTIVGVAFFAQWSLLSNITSSIILFFNHPVKLNDEIVIMEGKDYVFEGRIKDIGLFFTIVQTSDEEDLTLPNNIFITKTIKKVKI